MILHTRDAREIELRRRLVNHVGLTSQVALVDWLWENHKRSDVGFVDALSAIVQQTEEHGPEFLRRLVDFAKRPKEVREAEQQILAWFQPRAASAAALVAGHRGDPAVAGEKFKELGDDLESYVHRALPDLHRATVRGAILVSLKHRSGAFTLDVSTLVMALRADDPLAVTAKASWA